MVEDDSSYNQMVVFFVPSTASIAFPYVFTYKDRMQHLVTCTIEPCGNLLPSAGAPGEPPRQETKKEHWKRVGEKLNPSFKNRLTVVAPLSTRSAPQKRRFGQLREAFVDDNQQRTSYPYADEIYLRILLHDILPFAETFETYIILFAANERIGERKLGPLQERSNVSILREPNRAELWSLSCFLACSCK